MIHAALALLLVIGAASRLPLVAPEIKLEFEPKMKGEYSSLSIDQAGPHVRLDYRDGEGAKRYIEWVYPFFLTVTVECSVARMQNGIILYDYHLKNSVSSALNLSMFMVEAKGKISAHAAPTAHWRTEHLAADIWKRNLYQWWSGNQHDAGGMITPGAELSRFGLESTDLPTVVDCWASGPGPALKSNGELSETFDAFIREHFGLLKDSVCGITLGPRSTPPDLGDLRKYIATGNKQGWICAGSVFDELNNFARKASEAQNNGDLNLAIEHLRALEVSVNKHAKTEPPGITTEVEALLGMNATWIREKLTKESAAPEPTAAESSQVTE